MFDAEIQNGQVERGRVRKGGQYRLVNPTVRDTSVRMQFLVSLGADARRCVEDLVEVGQGEPDAWEERIEDWCRRWRLTDERGAAVWWVVQAAAAELAFRASAKGAYSSGEWACPVVDSVSIGLYGSLKEAGVLPEELAVLQPPTYRWQAHITGDSISVERRRILRDFERWLDSHIQAMQDWARDSRLVRTPIERTLAVHLEWFIRYQLNGEGPPANAADAAWRKALKNMAGILGIRLRRQKRGRPSKS